MPTSSARVSRLLGLAFALLRALSAEILGLAGDVQRGGQNSVPFVEVSGEKSEGPNISR